MTYYTLAEAFAAAGYRTAHFGQWHDVNVQFSAASPRTTLRFDPTNATGKVEVQWVRRTNDRS